jgi:magnesium-transporting ATPase (P-type)
MTVSAPAQPTGSATGIVSAATLPAADVLRELGVTAGEGLSSEEVGRRQARCGPNAVSSHRARLLPVLWHQLRSPLLGLLLTAALMGTVVHAGSAGGVVVAIGADTEFGKIATGLSTHQIDTGFQVGLRRFSMLLVYVAGALTTSIFVINVVLHKPIIDALLFSLAIAVGITPQLLPAVVSTSLAAGSRRMRRRKVLVKRLVCIEDLGDADVLFTDKTGTLTQGRINYMRAVPARDGGPDAVLRWGLLCTENTASDGQAVGGNPLDQALWQSTAAAGQRAALASYPRLAVLPFDHERRMVSVLVRDPAGQLILITKGAPETVLDRCVDVPAAAREALEAEFAAGNRHGRLLHRFDRDWQTDLLRRYTHYPIPHPTGLAQPPPPASPCRLLQHHHTPTGLKAAADYARPRRRSTGLLPRSLRSGTLYLVWGS